ncbi:MAG: hypothetical protein NC320_01635 [Clostridium sp.]|nr:hypothetical protein [Clostridium sp.]
MDNCLCLSSPDTDICLKPGNHVKLGRFEHDRWLVSYGWYTWGGNRPVCGWYLVRCGDDIIKPLQLPDLDDIYIIEN